MRSFKNFSIIILAVMLIFSTAFVLAQAGDQHRGGANGFNNPNPGVPGHHPHRGGFAKPDSCGRCCWTDSLTTEQKAELKETIKKLRGDSKTREEIHQAIVDLFNKWGLKLPPCGRFFGMGIRHWLGSQLTEEQKQILKDTRQKMRDEGASREEIHQAILDLLKQWGIEPPQKPARRPGARNPKSDVKSSAVEMNNFPNPFNPSTTISYRIEKPDYVTLSIYNIQGQLIRTLVDSYQNQGEYSTVWDGNDANGAKAASGLYVYTIKVGQISTSKQMMLTK
jgi:hypothetical protein